MNGLLDPELEELLKQQQPRGLLNPRTQGLMAAGAGLLSASGPSSTPQGLAPIGQAVQAGLGAYQGAQQNQLQGVLRGIQVKDLLRKHKLSEQQQAEINAYAQTLPPEQQREFTINPSEFLKNKFGAQNRQDQREFLQRESETARIFRETEAEKGRELQRELAAHRLAAGQDRSPYFQFLQTPGGFMAGNARTGQVTPVTIGGRQVMPAGIDPDTQRGLAAAKAGGKESGEARAQAEIDLPRVIDNANNSLQLIDQMVGSVDGKKKEHPGFQSAVGMRIPGLGLIPGSETSNFNTLLDQVKGGAFLEAFNSLKGGGQITEVEGKKATDAITRMQNAQSEAEFKKAAREYQGIIRLGVQRAQKKAGTYQGPDRRGVPGGVDPALWGVMTPEERALWAQ